MIEMIARLISDYKRHASLFDELGTSGYTVALKVRNVSPELYYSSLPQSWIVRYTNNSFMMADPVVDYMYRGSGVTRWSEIQHSRGPTKTAEFLSVARSEGLSYGAAVVRRHKGAPHLKSLVSVARPDRELTDSELIDLAHSFDALLTKLEEHQRPTERQIKVLQLLSEGHTHATCSKELHVSPDTIKREIELVRRVLGAKNATEAVAIATTLKLVNPVHAQIW